MNNSDLTTLNRQLISSVNEMQELINTFENETRQYEERKKKAFRFHKLLDIFIQGVFALCIIYPLSSTEPINEAGLGLLLAAISFFETIINIIIELITYFFPKTAEKELYLTGAPVSLLIGIFIMIVVHTSPACLNKFYKCCDKGNVLLIISIVIKIVSDFIQLLAQKTRI